MTTDLLLVHPGEVLLEVPQTDGDQSVPAGAGDRRTGEPHQRDREGAADDQCRCRSAPLPLVRAERGLLAEDAGQP